MKKILLLLLLTIILMQAASAISLNFTNITPQVVSGSTPSLYCIFTTNTSDFYIMSGSQGFNLTLDTINKANLSTPTNNITTNGWLITSIT